MKRKTQEILWILFARNTILSKTPLSRSAKWCPRIKLPHSRHENCIKYRLFAPRGNFLFDEMIYFRQLSFFYDLTSERTSVICCSKTRHYSLTTTCIFYDLHNPILALNVVIQLGIPIFFFFDFAYYLLRHIVVQKFGKKMQHFLLV